MNSRPHYLINDKEHKIITVQDMYNCTNKDNISQFIHDLGSILSCQHELRNITKCMPDDVLKDGYTWIDDGKNVVEITIKPQS